MTEREQLQSRLQHQQRLLAEAMRGRLIPTKKAVEINEAIQITKAQIERLDRDAAEELALKKAPIEDVLEVIALPLLADVMNDFVAGVDGMLRKHGCQQTIFSTYTQQIRRASLAIIDTLATAEFGQQLLDVDDTLVDALRKKIISFLKQRMNITDGTKRNNGKATRTSKAKAD